MTNFTTKQQNCAKKVTAPYVVVFMTSSEQLLLLGSAFGGLNGLLLTGYFFLQRSGQWSHRLLALLLLMLSVRILKSVLFYFNPETAKQILQLGLSACWMIGPLLYCYSQSVCEPARSPRRYLWQLVPPLLLVLLTGSLWPYAQYPLLWGGPLYNLINYSWLGYILLSGLLLWRTWWPLDKGLWRQSAAQVLLLTLWLSNLLIWGAFYFASYTSYISGALTFSVLLCCSALTAFYHLNADNTRPAAYASKKLQPDEAEPLIDQLQHWMQQQQPHLDANLTLPKLARQLGWPSARLSQLLNDNLAQSFPDYINSWRISHAQTLLRCQPVTKMQTLAENCGFNSLSTFYSAFKKFSGCTPARYRQNQPSGASGIINPSSGITS
jgi:AraC-like DNA-binding protein